MPLFSRNRVSSITRADLARAAGDWNTAARHYAEALTRNPARPEIWIQYGHALKEGGDPSAAEAAYRRALANDPRNADSHLQLGHVLKVQGKTEEAQSAYLRSFALRPDDRDAISGLRDLRWTRDMITALVGEPAPPRVIAAKDMTQVDLVGTTRRDPACHEAIVPLLLVVAKLANNQP